ncbi:hypothetical protein [Immundisolibacter sp.]
MSIAQRTAALAKASIHRYGTTVVVKHKTSSYDPGTGVNTVSESSVTTKAVVDKVDYKLMVSIGRDNSLGISKFILAADEQVAVGDSINLSGANYAIIVVSPVVFMDEAVTIELVGERQ